MAFTTTVLQPASSSSSQLVIKQDPASSLLATIILSLFAVQLTKKQMRKLKRKAMFALLKAKFTSLFSRRAALSTRTLLYILLGLAIVIIAFISPIAAVILLLIGILLLLLIKQ